MWSAQKRLHDCKRKAPGNRGSENRGPVARAGSGGTQGVVPLPAPLWSLYPFSAQSSLVGRHESEQRQHQQGDPAPTAPVRRSFVPAPLLVAVHDLHLDAAASGGSERTMRHSVGVRNPQGIDTHAAPAWLTVVAWCEVAPNWDPRLRRARTSGPAHASCDRVRHPDVHQPPAQPRCVWTRDRLRQAMASHSVTFPAAPGADVAKGAGDAYRCAKHLPFPVCTTA